MKLIIFQVNCSACVFFVEVGMPWLQVTCSTPRRRFNRWIQTGRAECWGITTARLHASAERRQCLTNSMSSSHVWQDILPRLRENVCITWVKSLWQVISQLRRKPSQVSNTHVISTLHGIFKQRALKQWSRFLSDKGDWWPSSECASRTDPFQTVLNTDNVHVSWFSSLKYQKCKHRFN